MLIISGSSQKDNIKHAAGNWRCQQGDSMIPLLHEYKVLTEVDTNINVAGRPNIQEFSIVSAANVNINRIDNIWQQDDRCCLRTIHLKAKVQEEPKPLLPHL